MAGPQQAFNVLEHMTGLLLNEFFRSLEPGNQPPDKLRLEYLITSMGPPAASQLENAVFLQRIDNSVLPLIFWYLDFTSGRDASWMRGLNADRFMQIWRSIDDVDVRMRSLRLALTVESVQGYIVRNSLIRQEMLAKPPFDDNADDFTEDGRLVAVTLLGQYVSDLGIHKARAKLGIYARSIVAVAFGVGGRVPANRREKLLSLFPDMTESQLHDITYLFDNVE